MRARYAFFAIAMMVGAACGSPAPHGNVDGGDIVDGASDATTPPTDSATDGGLTFGDVVATDAPSCTTLNIGILGNPGANSSSNFQAWLVAAGTSVTRIETNASDPAIDASTLAPFDVIVLDWLARDYTQAEAAVLQTRITNGGGLITMTGYNGSSTDFRANVLLAPMSVAYAGALLSGPVTTFATHPTTMGLTSVTFEGGYAVSDLGGNTSTRTPVAFLQTTTPVAYAITLGAGRAFAWGDEWIEFDSEWTTQPQIKQFWVDVFAWVAPQGCPLNPQ